MRKIVEQAEPFERFDGRRRGPRLCKDLAQDYKVEHIDDELKQYPILSFYRQGEFIDLCRGPHLPHAGKIGAFKLLSIAGAYWKKDTTRKQLQRLYATAFFSQKELDAYLHKLEEAKKRDHRLLGKQLKLFTISPLVGSGLILWMPKGAIVRGLLETFIKDELVKRGYQPVYTPHIGRLELYRTSGHFPYYRDAQFPPIYSRPSAGALDLSQCRCPRRTRRNRRKQVQNILKLPLSLGRDTARPNPRKSSKSFISYAEEFSAVMRVDLPDYRQGQRPQGPPTFCSEWLKEQEGYLLKPMNCPHHIQIYKAEPRSYRDLPVRLAEFGTVYRFEQTGELSGMTRVRGFTQDNAHLFVTPGADRNGDRRQHRAGAVRPVQSRPERLSRPRRPPRSEKRQVRRPTEDWENAEDTLLDVVKNSGMNYTAEEGEAAFYGPKIDFVVRDCIGREWQLGTVQLDYNLPKRFEPGIHRQGQSSSSSGDDPSGAVRIDGAVMGILIEHFAGAFPLWLAPEQARILPVSEKFGDYGRKVEAELKATGFRAAGDYRPEKIGAKIREAQLEKIPYMLVVGEKERRPARWRSATVLTATSVRFCRWRS